MTILASLFHAVKQFSRKRHTGLKTDIHTCPVFFSFQLTQRLYVGAVLTDKDIHSKKKLNSYEKEGRYMCLMQDVVGTRTRRIDDTSNDFNNKWGEKLKRSRTQYYNLPREGWQLKAV